LYDQIGGYSDRIKKLDEVLAGLENVKSVPWHENHPWPLDNTAPEAGN